MHHSILQLHALHHGTQALEAVDAPSTPKCTAGLEYMPHSNTAQQESTTEAAPEAAEGAVAVNGAPVNMRLQQTVRCVLPLTT